MVDPTEERESGSIRSVILRGLRSGHRRVAARRGHHDPRCGRHVWPAMGRRIGFLRLRHWRHHRLRRGALRVARLRPASLRKTELGRRRGHAEGRSVLSNGASPGADLPFLPGQSGDGAHRDPGDDLLLGQPAGDAAGHDRLRQRRHSTRADQDAFRRGIACAARIVCAAGHFSAVGEVRAGPDQGAQGVPPLEKAASLRPQSDCHRRRCSRPGRRLCRRRRQGKSHASGRHFDGRRLPQFRLRAFEGSYSCGKARPSGEARERARLARRAHGIRFRGRDGAHQARHCDDRTARFGRTLCGPGRRSAARSCKNCLSMVGRGHERERRANADHACDRDRGGFDPDRAADPGPFSHRVPYLRHVLGLVPASAASGRVGWRSDRM